MEDPALFVPDRTRERLDKKRREMAKGNKHSSEQIAGVLQQIEDASTQETFQLIPICPSTHSRSDERGAAWPSAKLLGVGRDAWRFD